MSIKGHFISKIHVLEVQSTERAMCGMKHKSCRFLDWWAAWWMSERIQSGALPPPNRCSSRSSSKSAGRQFWDNHESSLSSSMICALAQKAEKKRVVEEETVYSNSAVGIFSMSMLKQDLYFYQVNDVGDMTPISFFHRYCILLLKHTRTATWMVVICERFIFYKIHVMALNYSELPNTINMIY